MVRLKKRWHLEEVMQDYNIAMATGHAFEDCDLAANLMTTRNEGYAGNYRWEMGTLCFRKFL